METVYRLRDQHTSLAQMQQASLTDPHVGLKITHGLIGTDEWWQNIQAGALPLHSVRGVVRGLWLGMYHSEAGQYLLELENKSQFSGMTGLEATESASKFTLGRYVEVDFVFQELKSPLQGQSAQSRVDIEVRVDTVSDSSVSPIGPCYFTHLDEIRATKPTTSARAGPSRTGRRAWWWPWK